MALTTLYLFDDGDSIGVIGAERPDVVVGLIQQHAEEHGLPAPDYDEKDVYIKSCRNARIEDGTVRYDLVENPLLVEGPVQSLHIWDSR